MKSATFLITAMALVAGPAAAQGSFNSGQPQHPWGLRGPAVGAAQAPAWKPSPGYGAPVSRPAPAYTGPTTARIQDPPAAAKPERFKPYKPYQPYKPASVFGQDRKR